MSAPTPDQAQILEIAMANLKEPGEKPKEYWAFGERYLFTSARPDLGLDDERHYKSDNPQIVEARREALVACNVKVRDFAFAPNKPKAQSCRCRLTAMRRAEWNKILKFHGLPEMEIHIPQQIVGGSQSQADAPTQPNSPVATEPNSPARTEPPSPARTVGPSAFRAQGLSRQPDAVDLTNALAAAATDLTLRDKTAPADNSTATNEVPTRAFLPSQPQPALPLVGPSTLRRETAVAIPSFPDHGAENTTTFTTQVVVASVGAHADRGTEPPTGRISSAPTAASVPISASGSGVPRTPFNASQSLSRMIFGGDSPLTPGPGTPNMLVTFSGESLKRKRSGASISKIVSHNSLLRKLSIEKVKEETPHPTKRVRKTVEHITPPTATRSTRSSSKKTQAAHTTTVATTPPHTTTARVRPTRSVRLSRAATAALAAPSKVKQAVLGKLAKAKAKPASKRQGRL